jgi:nitrite reductase/ring-hydroxylating ferredoxin subunit
VPSLRARLADELGYDPDAARSAPAELSSLDTAGIRAGTIVAARDGDRAVAVARLASGRLVVVDDACPHDGNPVSDGFVEGERIVCARHGWELEPCASRCLQRAGRLP